MTSKDDARPKVWEADYVPAGWPSGSSPVPKRFERTTIDPNAMVPIGGELAAACEAHIDSTPITARDFREAGLPLPPVIPDDAVLVGMKYAHDPRAHTTTIDIEVIPGDRKRPPDRDR